MKLRFRKNTLRLRVNRTEVQSLAAGDSLAEKVFFPNGASLSYSLQVASGPSQVTFQGGVIAVIVREEEVRGWAGSGDTGIYFDLPTNGPELRVLIEKDLECLDGPPEEYDPEAYPRGAGSCRPHDE